MNEFQARRACFLSFSPPSFSFSSRSAIARASQENKLFPRRRISSQIFVISLVQTRSNPQQRKRVGKREEDRTTTLENGASHAMDAYYALVRLAFFPSFARETTASRPQDATVSGAATAVSRAVARRDRQHCDEDVSTPCTLGFLVCGRNEKAFHENAYMRAIENWSTIVLQLKDTLCAFNRNANAMRHDGPPVQISLIYTVMNYEMRLHVPRQ